MKMKIIITSLFVFLCDYGVAALSFPGPRVYVVTPSPRMKNDESKPTPFYYHNWMRRMDKRPDSTTTTTAQTSTLKVKTPDLIFAEFESDGSKQKSIRKLLENERIQPKKTTMTPIYVPDEEENKVTRVVNYGLPVKTINHNESWPGNNKYLLISHGDNNKNLPVYVTSPPTTSPATTTKITTTTESPINVQNIWHVIDSEKSDKYSNNWEEISLESKNEENANSPNTDHGIRDENIQSPNTEDDDITIDDNFALPGFATEHGNGAENESRAIRTEQNIRFPYINLKPFQVKSSKTPVLNNISNGKKNNLFTSLDNFYDLKSPVRGEAQDTVPKSPLIDRYNPAQPYLPQQKYGSNLSKQSSGKATSSLVPPPPPPPNPSGNDFPAPTSYESFPPYAPSAPDFAPVPAPAPLPSPPVSVSLTPSKSVDITDLAASVPSSNGDGPTMEMGYRYKPPVDIGDTDNNAPTINSGYQYKPPSAPMPQFYPTPVPSSKPFQGYSYNKPSMTADTSPMTVADKPEFQGYHYSKPVFHKPPENMPSSYGSLPTYGTDDFPPDTYDHDDSPPHIYGHDDTPHIEDDDYSPPDSHDSDDDMAYGKKPYKDMKNGDDMQDMGMKPPALHTDIKPGAYGPPPDDHGFPSDFPTDFKFPHDFDHDHEHEHYHIVEHPTTTTETPRVNRFSYYYLGKKLYYLPLYFSVYFIVYVGALIIKAVLRHKIVYPNSWRPNTTTATFFSKRSVDEYLSHENLHELTKKVTNAISKAAEKYLDSKNKST
ncbi:uncharacterized protein LOC112043037 [Bicyclus anynana]|uniref:Uncharacterized protein LOC112043037 n=1 Tax=Bicyclus anynana TaxID=110368 RepID=A0A6J1MMN4_BICAN|nr:uncharacterized protein LOC112043037 [Bicyclus anynana]